MNSYPAELLVQLAPVMFVAGLDPLPNTTPPPPVPEPRVGSQSPPPPPPKAQDPFVILAARLRDVLQAQRKPSIWASSRSKIFQVILVDKTVRFPPQKLIPPEDPTYSTAHSPLSPLTPTSPLYPDGLIAPIWIRKHTSLVPSVFVLFLRLFETPHAKPRSPLDQQDPDHERERAEEERKRDIELSTEVARRKGMTSERGIKLTVVLMTSRRMLDDPSLESRLTFIRRQSGLDSRAALFVLSPVSPAELIDFVRSLQDALYEPAVEYYTSHSKRVRRKRNRHSQTLSSYNPPSLVPVGAASTRPLRTEGWTVRYEYKMACFAEFRGEDEVALKHYQDAYTTLMIMFGSTAILPPRTKRWAEAKVLADAINVKIVKLYLYNNEHALALSYHNLHMRRFADFSRGWGIGEETFEYWSWMSRQHRVLAELLEQGSRSTLTFPNHGPASRAASALSPSALGPGGAPMDLDAVRALGLNPSHALQHPGHYYYMAARCTEARRERFLASESMSQGASTAPGYANEKKVDHLTIILELYTKSYELFRTYNSTASQGRLTLWIACRIAHTYYESGKFDMAVRFYERIAKTYRREKWNAMLRPLFSTWYVCAQKLGDVELIVRLLVEMIGYGDEDEPGTLQDDLLEVLRSSVPSSPDDILLVDLKESEPILNTSVVFWRPEVRVGEPAAFQISLVAPSKTVISELPISSITIVFPDEYAPVVIRHNASGPATSEAVRMVRVGHIQSTVSTGHASEVEANLRWKPDDRIIVTGTISSDGPGLLSVSNVIITLEEGNWTIEIPHEPCAVRESCILPPRWLSSLNPVRFIPVSGDEYSSVVVRHRPHELHISFSHQQPALLDEEYPITIEITNNDDRHLDIVVDVLLQPTEVDEAVQRIVFKDQKSSGLIKGIPFGTIPPGVSVVDTLVLLSGGAPGDRIIDISVQSSSTSGDPRVQSPDATVSHDTSSPISHDTSEILRTLLIPTVSAFSVTQDVEYTRSLRPPPALADLSVLENGMWDDSLGGEAVVMTKFECLAPWGLEIEHLQLLRRDNQNAKIVRNSAEESAENMLQGEYLTGDQFCDVCRVSLALTEGEIMVGNLVPGPGEYVVEWRRITPSGTYGPRSTSSFTLPPLRPPRDGLVALLTVPSTAKLHVPTPMHLSVRNLHSSRSAVVSVSLDPHALDGFVVAGLRSGRLPLILPGAEEKLTWNLVPIECGLVRVPTVKVVDYRGVPLPADDMPSAGVEHEGGEVVKVVDTRFGGRKGGILEGDQKVDKDEDGQAMGTILVLP
ncbi:Gryzun, putative trafficking through golgi-domain-containing protein [Phlebopus sp. FC_14]|nr:Gryzun, putative trafficking through golgi-domain-containing protein [Phlebopus sp. FC_14]